MPGVHDLKFEFTGETEAELNVFDEDGGLQGANDSLCRDVGAALSRWYPGHPWMVRAEIENGMSLSQRLRIPPLSASGIPVNTIVA